MMVTGVARLDIRPTATADPATGTPFPTQQGASFNSQRQRFRQRWLLTGVTRDSTGSALGVCTVNLFTTFDGLLRATTVSDATGAFGFSLPTNGWACYIVAYKAGSPDVAGTTVNTLVPVLA